MIPKQLFLMHGYPGSGKSFRAAELAVVTKGIIINADEYFTFYIPNMHNSAPDEEYFFDAQHLHAAHNMCQGRCQILMKRNYPSIIIDNTNLSFKEFEPYVIEAARNSYRVILEEPNTHWKDSIEECFKRGSHNVPMETYIRMRNRRELYSVLVDKINKKIDSVITFDGD